MEINDDDKIECVGSLLIHSHDVQELDSNHIPSAMPSVATLQKRPTVGTLLVPTDNENSTSSTTTATDQSSKDNDKQSSPSLIRRITDKLIVDIPEDCDYDEWME
jgi:hypothetical protein